MKQLLLAIILLLGFLFLSFDAKYNIKLANGGTLQIKDSRKVLPKKQYLSGTSHLVKDRSSKQVQKQSISKVQERPSLKSKWNIRKSLTQRGRGLISEDELEIRDHDSGSMAYFSRRVPFTSDYLHAMHHPPRNN